MGGKEQGQYLCLGFKSAVQLFELKVFQDKDLSDCRKECPTQLFSQVYEFISKEKEINQQPFI